MEGEKSSPESTYQDVGDEVCIDQETNEIEESSSPLIFRVDGKS